VQDGPEVGLIATFDSCSELLKPIRAQQQPALQAYLTKPIREQKADRRQQQRAAKRNVLTRNHSGKSNQPKGPSGGVKNRVNAMNAQNHQLKYCHDLHNHQLKYYHDSQIINSKNCQS